MYRRNRRTKKIIDVINVISPSFGVSWTRLFRRFLSFELLMWYHLADGRQDLEQSD